MGFSLKKILKQANPAKVIHSAINSQIKIANQVITGVGSVVGNAKGVVAANKDVIGAVASVAGGGDIMGALGSIGAPSQTGGGFQAYAPAAEAPVKADNTMLYVGLGAVALVAIFLVMRKS